MVAEEPQAGQAGWAAGGGMALFCIASADRLELIASLAPAERPQRNGDACRGVLAETALTGRQRYEWRLLLPLLHTAVDEVLADFTPQEEEVGPPRPPAPGFDSVPALAAHLHGLLDGFEAAPFTLQRLCELLLEPRKQYARLDKVALAIEKLLFVTTTQLPDAPAAIPPPPRLGSLGPVNENPPSPYLDGRQPQVLDPQQHQALLQQQQAAMAAAVQQHAAHQAALQQHAAAQQQGPAPGAQGGQLGYPAGAPNGLPEQQPAEGGEGGASRRGGEAEAAGGEPMQVDAAVGAAAGSGGAQAPRPAAISAAEAAEAAGFVESALADADDSGRANGGAHAGAARAEQQPQRQPSAGGAAPPDGAEAQQAAAMELSPLGKAAAQQQQQQQQPSAAPADLAEVVARLQQHLPQATQVALLPALLQHRQSHAPAGAGPQAPPAAPAADAGALVRLVVATLAELPADKAALVLGQLQPLLPPHVAQQLRLAGGQAQ